jgi:PAS domain S-box-containing protein
MLGLSTWLALLVGGALVPLLVFALLTLGWMARNQGAAAERSQADTTRALALAVDAEVRAWKAALLALSESNDLAAGRWAAFDLEARRVAARYDGWIVVTDVTGQQRLNTLRPYGIPLPASPDNIRAVFKTPKPVVTDLFFGKVSQRLVVSVIVPVWRDGKVPYVMDMALGPERLSRLLEQQGLPPTWVAGINDGQDQVVARSVDAKQRVGQAARGWRKALPAHVPSGVFTATLGDGREVRTTFQRLTEAPSTLVLAIPISEARSAWATTLLRFLLVAALLTLTAAGVALYVGRKIANPVVALAASSESLMRGGDADLGTPSAVREVAALRQALADAAASARAHVADRERAAAAIEAARAAAATAAAVRASEERLRFHVENTALAVIEWDSRFIVTRWSGEAERMFGWSAAETVGKPLVDLRMVHPPDIPIVEGVMAKLSDGVTRQLVSPNRNLTKDGRVLHCIWHNSVLVDDQGRMASVLSLVLNDTARIEAEGALRTALAEKDLLLREVHHRVKNNLQMLCDMIFLQLEAMPDRDQHQDLQDVYGRVYAIARLHEHLHQSMRAGYVLLCEYIGQLSGGFQGLYPKLTVRVEVPEEPLYLDMDRAIHLGLIANELLANAAKHAFPAGERGEVMVRLGAVGDETELRVSDAGRGLPANFDLGQSKTLGLRMVHLLAQRLGAKLTVENDPGASFTLRFQLRVDPPLEPRDD